DLGSTNGVQVNGQRVHGTISLSAGDQVIIGDIPYTFLLGAAPKASPKPAPPAIKTNPPRPAPIQEKPEPVPYPNSEMSSEIPIMLDDPDDGFDILGGSSRSNRQQERRMAGSDSRPELVAD
ncbi:MAG: FHA domain-containing protein, partial [Planctomycetaceae bacterium]|nr:FHA domain-containing protein [Planctomycetaceae bacterium]